MTSNEPARSGVITVLSDVGSDGHTYIATVQLDGDTARTLSRDEGYAWAGTVLAAAARAEYDARVWRQMIEVLHTPVDLAVGCLRDLRADRPPLNHTATAPMHLEPGVNSKGDAFLAVHLNGTQIGQWTCRDARSHAQGVLEVASFVDLDAGYNRYLRGTVGLDAVSAHLAVASLSSIVLNPPETT